MGTVSNVTTAKPNVTGAIFVAPVGTTLPTDSTTSLATAFKALGFAGEDGLTNANTFSSEAFRDWGGLIVCTSETEHEDKFRFKLIEVLNADVLKEVHGASNVTGSLSAGIAVAVNNLPHEEKSWVFETILRNGVLKRFVVPNAAITEVGEVVYVGNDLAAYDVTLTATPDEDGNTHYEYIK